MALKHAARCHTVGCEQPIYGDAVRVNVVPWSPEWPLEFAAVREELSRACVSIPVQSIEHVGSTSVPGLAAKPVLDVTIVVARVHLGDTFAALEEAGYRHMGERGIPDRHAFSPPPQGPARHVYVAVDGSLSLRNQLAVRDVLRTHPDLRNRYEDLKLSLAARDLDDMDQYLAAKSPLIQEVLRTSGRFSDDELGAIAAMNSGSDTH